VEGWNFDDEQESCIATRNLGSYQFGKYCKTDETEQNTSIDMAAHRTFRTYAASNPAMQQAKTDGSLSLSLCM
jgi:hypothetical protein